MPLIIPCTERFVRALEELTYTERSIVVRKIRLFVTNPCSKSLKVHRYMALENMWEFYADRRLRVLFERREGQPHLSDVGFHAILDKACRCRYTLYTHALHVEENKYHYTARHG